VKRRALTLLLLCACAGGALAQEKTGSEKRDFTVAQKAFEDHLYQLSRSKLEAFLKEHPKSAQAPQAALLLAEACYHGGDPAQALQLAQKVPAEAGTEQKGGFLFWEAQAKAALDKPGEAAEAFARFLKEYADHPLADEARLALSSALSAAGKPEEALKALEPLLEDPKKPGAQRAFVQQARLLIAANKMEEASRVLKQVAEAKPKPPLNFEAAYWQGQLALAQKNPDAALAALETITGNSRAHPREWVAKAWFATGLAWQEKKDWNKAIAAYETAFTVGETAEMIEPAVVRYLKCHLENNTLAKGALKVRELAGQKGEEGFNSLLAIAKYYLEAGNPDAAITELGNLAQRYPDHPAAPLGRYLMAEAFLGKNDRKSAVEILEKLAAKPEESALARKAGVKLGELLFSQGDYAGAAFRWIAVSKAIPDKAEAESLMFRSLTSLSRAGNLEEFEKAEKQFLAAFPENTKKNALLLEKARLFETGGKDAEAQKIYQQLLSKEGQPAERQEALLKLGLSHYWNGNYEEAARLLGEFEKQFPESPNLPEAGLRRVQSGLFAGSLPPAQAREALEALAKRFPDHALTPMFFFQGALTFYEQQNYLEAQSRFEDFSTRFPKHELVPVTLYLNGLSALKLEHYKEAVALLEKVPDTSPLKADARLAQIRCYMWQNEFSSALSIADSLLKTHKDDYVYAEASLRKADCLYTLGSAEPARYQEAIKVAQGLQKDSSCTAAQKAEAGYLLGKALQKTKQDRQALQVFMDVVYSKELPENISQQQEPINTWLVKCGIEAAQILEDQKNIKGALEIYRILERLSSPNRQEFRRTIEDLRARHFLYE
jgi:TolA-binding protein